MEGKYFITGILMGLAIAFLLLLTNPNNTFIEEKVVEEKKPTPIEEREQIIHIHILDKSMCKFPV